MLDGWVDRLDNFKNLDKGYSFKEVISAERIKMGDSDSQQRSNNPCILETGFSMGISPCPWGRKVGGGNKGIFKEVKEVKKRSKAGVWTRVLDRPMSPISLNPPVEACGPKRKNNVLSTEES